MIKKTTLSVLTLAASLSAGQALALNCGEVITKSTKLKNDLSNCPGNGIVIGAPDIKLDLGGHTISGVSVGIGVDNTAGYEGVTIQNGRIHKFSYGVRLDNATRNRLKKLLVSHNEEGIYLFQSDSNRIEKNTISNNIITGVTLDASSYNQVEENSSFNNENFGIGVEKGSDYNRIKKNKTSDNLNSGILVDSASSETLIERTDANRNGNDGILVVNATTVVKKNTANNNGQLGINAVFGAIDGGGNKAKGNGNAAQCTNVVCQ